MSAKNLEMECMVISLLTWYCLFEIEVTLYGYVYLVSSGSLCEPLISTLTMTQVSSYFGKSSLLLPKNNYHIQCHNSYEVVDIQEVMYILYSMVGWLKSIEYLGIRCMKSLHRSLSYNGASLSHKNGEFYSIFKLGISGVLRNVVIALAD